MRSMILPWIGIVAATARVYAALTRPASANEPVAALTSNRVAKASAAKGSRPMVAPISGVRTALTERMRL
jgi:hypothetical protein